MAKQLSIFILAVLFMLFASVTISESLRWTTKITMIVGSDVETESSSGDETGDSLSEILSDDEKGDSLSGDETGDSLPENGVPLDCEENTRDGGCDLENQEGCLPHCECYEDKPAPESDLQPVSDPKPVLPPFCISVEEYMQVDE